MLTAERESELGGNSVMNSFSRYFAFMNLSLSSLNTKKLITSTVHALYTNNVFN